MRDIKGTTTVVPNDEESERLINAYYVRELLVIAREKWSDIYLPYLSNTIHIHMQRFVVSL